MLRCYKSDDDGDGNDNDDYNEYVRHRHEPAISDGEGLCYGKE